jgi:Mg2+-importing ATPase
VGRQIAGLFANPLVLILLGASAISALLGEHVDAVLIATIVLTSISINFWQSSRSQHAAERLRASVTPTATVCRDGEWTEVPIRLVVRGDVFRLSAGDLVPADGRLIESKDLSVQQSMLTGESVPADKHASTAAAESTAAGPDAPALVFLGTSIVSGMGVAVATATGSQTMFGAIAARLSERPPATEFEHGLHRFSMLILRTTVVLVLFILLVGIALRRDAFETLLFAVALGVGLTPEFLPMIVSVTLAEGALRMAREQVIVRHLPAIQNFGSLDVLCSDKTGTLTSGVMQVDASVDPFGADSDRALTLAAVNSRLQTGFRNPLDAAILQRMGGAADTWAKVDEIPFDFERRRMSVASSSVADPARRLLITKGAPESVLAVSMAVEIAGQLQPMDAAARDRCTDALVRLGADGHRVIAVGYRWFESRDTFAREDENDLVLAGFVSFADPILPDAAQVLGELKADGVTVKILTGDQDVVAHHVCRQIGISEDAIVRGDEIDRLDDAALSHVAERASVFTRVSPAQKNRVISALKARGHVVGYIGDGINDAPSLRTADVGISVVTATDVAREAADVVLGKRSLEVLHKGILEGRRASGNTMKYLLMGTSSNFGNMFSMAIASVFLPFLPMLPTQILLNNLLYDLAQITIPSDNVDREYLERPRRWDIRLIRDFMIFIGPISSIFDFLTFYVLLHVFSANETSFHTGWFVESLATQTLVLFVIRTMGNPFASPPSAPLIATTLTVVAVGVLIPALPFAGRLGFAVPPFSYLAFVAAATTVYLALVELMKRIVVRRLGAG